VARHYEDHLALSPFICWEIMRRDLNVVHAFQSAGAWAATMAIRGKSPSLVFSLQRTPDRRFLTARHFRLEMLLRVAEKAAACTVPDIEASRTFERYLLRHPEVADTVGDLEVAKIAERFEQIYRASGGGT
jgi:hypothetical protein